MMIGFDTATELTDAVLQRAVAKRVGFVAGYLKYLTPPAAARILAHGLALVVIFETTAARALTGAPGGVADGRLARAQAESLGVPAGAAIYATADFGETAPQDGVVVAYFAAFTAALGDKYRLGVYGEGAVCQLMLDRGVTRLTWLAGGAAMRGTAAFAASGQAMIVQDVGDKQGLALGIDIDSDTALVAEFGQWPAAAPVGGTVEVPVAIPSARDMQTALAAAGFYTGAIDGDFGRLSWAALRAYYASPLEGNDKP